MTRWSRVLETERWAGPSHTEDGMWAEEVGRCPCPNLVDPTLCCGLSLSPPSFSDLR